LIRHVVPLCALVVVVSMNGHASAERAAPKDILDRVHQLGLRVTMTPDPLGTGLRIIELYAGPEPRREPYALGPDGKPWEANAPIDAKQAGVIVDVLTNSGFFERAVRTHSERMRPPHTPVPIDFRPSTLAPAPRANVEVRIVVYDDDWYRYAEAHFAWSASTRALLTSIQAAVTGDAATLVSQLLTQLPSK
jgi:hypothetical protein